MLLLALTKYHTPGVGLLDYRMGINHNKSNLPVLSSTTICCFMTATFQENCVGLIVNFLSASFDRMSKFRAYKGLNCIVSTMANVNLSMAIRT